MITEEQRIEWLLELQDHPEQLTNEQLQQILADNEMCQLVQQLGFAKRSFKHQDLKGNTPDVDNEWEKFAATHAEELDTLDERESKSRFTFHLATHKIAASFIGVLLASGFALAALLIVHNINTPKTQAVRTEQEANAKPSSSLPTDTIKTDTISSVPYVFNNVALDSMLTVIASAHQVQVVFKDDAARQLRFHFVWKREDSLARVVEKLNTFEAVNIVVENKTLVVR